MVSRVTLQLQPVLMFSPGYESLDKEKKIDFLSQNSAFVLTFVGTFKLNFFTFADIKINGHSSPALTLNKWTKLLKEKMQNRKKSNLFLLKLC